MRGMQDPLVLHELELKRLAAYLATHPQMTWNFEYQELPNEVTIVTDSDWAGDEVTRRSRGGGFEYIGKSCIDSWAGQQATRALSSGEAEYVEMTIGAARGIFTKNLFTEMGVQMTVKVCGDSTAAIGICSRLGVGRVRHLDVKYLWLQEKVADREVVTKKVPTNENEADIMTKALDPSRHHELLKRLPMTLMNARGNPGHRQQGEVSAIRFTVQVKHR